MAARAKEVLTCFGGDEFCYGDGRMAPYEWLHHEGRLLKMDVWGHEWDHTCVGRQSYLWEVAGAAVEWRMNRSARMELLKRLNADDASLRSYTAAYCAFKLGLLSFSGGTGSGEWTYLCSLLREILDSSAVGNGPGKH